ncbi:MAG: adenylate/guanylate cyclase domain-containing protein [Spirochaetes bacterium]|nr:adenylate/guanylate cyclase domain-containing protein [Spirochaetota bacterium]
MKISVRFNIVFILVTLIIITGVTIVFISYLGSKNSVYFLVENMLKEVAKTVTNETVNYLNNAPRASQITNFLISNDMVDPDNFEIAEPYFKKILKSNKELSSCLWGTPQGNSIVVRRMIDDTISSRLNTMTKNSVIYTWLHENPEYFKTFKNDTVSLKKGYDARKRTWYKDGLKSKDGQWTDLYVSTTDKNMMFGYAVSIFDNKNKFLGVYSIGISFFRMSYFLNTLKIGKSGKAFMFNNKYEIVALPVKDENEIFDKLMNKYTDEKGVENYKFFNADDVKEKEIGEAIKIYKNKDIKDKSSILYTFTFDDKKYLSLITPFPADLSFNLTAGILIPEEDIMYLIYRNNIIVIIFSIFFILLSIATGFVISKSISGPLKMLAGEADKIRELNLSSDVKIKTYLTEINIINNSFENMKKGLKSFKKYVPGDLVVQLMKMQKEAVIEGKKTDITILFSDIENFTGISEKLKPEELMENLTPYFKGMSSTIHENKGTVDKFIGDAIMAFWGAPIDIQDHAVCACRAALQCSRFSIELAKRYKDQNKLAFNTRIGVNTGEATVGNMGYEERLNYTAIGDNVNLASRLEGLNKFYATNIIISEFTFEKAKEYIEARILDIVTVKGRTHGVKIYELLSEKGNLVQEKQKLINFYNEGIKYYLSGNWNEAKKIFTEIINNITPLDKPSKIMLSRCSEYLINPPDKEWDGIYIHKEK